MESSSNIIKFPKASANVERQPPDPEKMQDGINLVKYNHIDQTLNTILPMLFNNIELAGFHIIPDADEEGPGEYMKDCSLAIEAIRSILCKYHGIRHPFQTLCSSIFEDGGDGVLKVVKNVNIELKPEDMEIFENEE